MFSDAQIDKLTSDLPDRKSARRFINEFDARHPSIAAGLAKNIGLSSDVLVLASFSPLLATTLLQHPEYISFLARKKPDTQIPAKEELLESLARFSSTHSQSEPHILVARFRRRELLRIYLRDIRRLGTIAEITEEISNLADAILEHALRIARQDLDNLYGMPLETDEKKRTRRAGFCVVSLGKLGSKELNYSSDIDLLFLYSSEGNTSGQGVRGAVTNREYFVKLAERILKIVGEASGEGAAYRVDMRLRPHGRVGALAIAVNEAIDYYKRLAKAWERQMLIRLRASAGDGELFKKFFEAIESSVYSDVETIESALRNVRLSKEQIDLEKREAHGFNVKLGRGGIREIEFIAQALQLAYGGKDSWLRVSHTLISLSRLEDRGLIIDRELTELSDAYDFLRRVEHRLQMRDGLQTHLVSHNDLHRSEIAKRMNFESVGAFDEALSKYTGDVNRIFKRVFGEAVETNLTSEKVKPFEVHKSQTDSATAAFRLITASHEKSTSHFKLDSEQTETIKSFARFSPHFCNLLAANPRLVASIPDRNAQPTERNFVKLLEEAVAPHDSFPQKLSALRIAWATALLEIVAFDIFHKLGIDEIKTRLTELAEASLRVAHSITQGELNLSFPEVTDANLILLALGKLGSRGLDYGSDLDLVFVFDAERAPLLTSTTAQELYTRATEIFVNVLSSFTRDGNLYRVDLRLRPDGKNGATVISEDSFLEYLKQRAAIWEMLAYVKLRAVPVNSDSGLDFEKRARGIIHAKAAQIPGAELRDETKRIRARLAHERVPHGYKIDLKYGEGGILDVYFSVRFLQLAHGIPDDENSRSTSMTLLRLYDAGVLSSNNFARLKNGHAFLSELDHNLRLTVGRSRNLPLANTQALQIIYERMNMSSLLDLQEALAHHRIEINSAYEEILS